ncbi:MAG: GldG family protein [Clostridia bacterium]|nr:GldG family protein [Clostridia bacterium]
MMKRVKQHLTGWKVNIVFALLAVLLIMGSLLLNGIAQQLSKRYPLRFDLTDNAAYQIGTETKTLLAGITQKVEIFVLSDEAAFGGSNYLDQAKYVIQQFPRYGKSVVLTFVDYASNPSFPAGFPEFSLSDGDLIVRCGERAKQIKAVNLFHYAYSAGGSLTIESSRAEEALASAILHVTGDEMVNLAVLTGHGVTESTLFTALLADNNYTLTTVNPLTDALHGYDGALLLAPASDLSADVLRKLEDFLYNGGWYGKTLFYTASASQGVLPNLERFLAEWGISFLQGAVFETKAERTYGNQPFYPLAGYQEGRFADMVRDANMPFLMPLSKPMRLLFTERDGYVVEPLLMFGDSSGVRPADAGEDFTSGQTEIFGPMPALTLSSYSASGTSADAPRISRVVVSASTEMLTSVPLHNTSVANSEYLLALLGSLTGKDTRIAIQPKSLSGKTLGVTGAQMTMLGILLIGALPLTILCAGIAVWLIRRYR